MKRPFSFCFVIGLTALFSVAPAHAQAYRAPRTADGKPDLQGIWQVHNTANWGLESSKAGPFRISRPLWRRGRKTLRIG
jgi:hypothetical protein